MTRTMGACADEVKEGVGESWSEYSVLGATRDGLAPAKEERGKEPGAIQASYAGHDLLQPNENYDRLDRDSDEGQPSGMKVRLCRFSSARRDTASEVVLHMVPLALRRSIHQELGEVLCENEYSSTSRRR